MALFKINYKRLRNKKVKKWAKKNGVVLTVAKPNKLTQSPNEFTIQNKLPKRF